MAYKDELNLTIDKLIKISIALNENIIANRKRKKEDKISTDKFIRQFNITRKKFSKAIKGTGIKYNKSTFLYDIPGKESLVEEKGKSNLIVKEEKYTEDKSLLNKQISNLVKDVIKNSYPEIAEIKDILNWYKDFRKKENAIKISQINLNNKKLTGNIVSKSFKTYEPVINEFIKYCKFKKQTQKDLLALALIEFMDKYKIK